MSTQRRNLKVKNYKDDWWINPQRWEETSAKRRKTPKTRTPLFLQGNHNSSLAREQGWMENECDELTEAGFGRWLIRTFCELKGHVLNQYKKTKNVDEM